MPRCTETLSSIYEEDPGHNALGQRTREDGLGKVATTKSRKKW